MKNSLSALHKTDWDFPNSNKADGIHSIHPYPAKFISEIPKTLIDILGVPKDTWILDPFCGSSTTGVATILLNRKYVGIDLDDEYLQLSVKRLKEALTKKESKLPVGETVSAF